MTIRRLIDTAFSALLSERVKERSERWILSGAILSYVLHLGLIILNQYGVVRIDSTFVQNPIAAIYTPFSFILIYEVYLLIYYLPKSFSSYIGKQYEIITLIVIRRIFKDISELELTTAWFTVQSDLQFTYDVVTSLILFGLIYLYNRSVRRRQDPAVDPQSDQQARIDRFIRFKRILATVLVPVLVVFAAYSLIVWGAAAISDYRNGILVFRNINHIFFDEFFTILIIADVLILLASFFRSDRFHAIMRNSGFVISTILIKISFSTSGLVNNALIIGSVLFGCLILLVHNLYENAESAVSSEDI